MDLDARGDSAAALNGAIASVAGSHAIIELNLVSFERNEWTDKIRDELKVLKSAYTDLLQNSSACITTLENENLEKHKQSFDAALSKMRSGNFQEVVRSEAAIEKLARDVQNTLWKYRELIWKDETPGSYIDVLKPEIAIRSLMGYDFRIGPLGIHVTKDGVEVATAGEIDQKKKIILVSSDMNSPIQSFTAAHELGHALLHKSEVLHRDRPLDGSSVDKDIREWQADKFATFFLMPAKLVIGVFQEVFSMDQFVIHQDTVFALNQGRVSDFRAKVKGLRGLAFFLANFRGSKFRSMAEIFQVSPLAMARRLEELELVKF
jgi:Zn-dependent peptidase ImmA (M78 family)